MARRGWTKDDIILAMWEWQEKHGRQPGWEDWAKTGGDEHPTSYTVNTVFDSWSEAIIEAGFTPYEKPMSSVVDKNLARELRRQGLSDAEIARRLGISTHVLVRRIGRRPRLKPVGKKRTREQRIADLKEALQKGDE